jgi:DNA mismatch repair protein MutS
VSKSPVKKSPQETPMMRQFWAAKKKHPEALLFFRMGDFYELFGDDAKLASKKLGLTLTSRSKEKDLPMAGVPVRSMEGYLVRLVKMGHSVAICEQIQDPKEAKGIVERDVVRVVSPGTLVEDENLDGSEPLFVLAVHLEAPSGRGKDSVREDDYAVGLAWADLSTGTFRCSATTVARLGEELARVQPAELLLPDLEESDALRPTLDRVRSLVQQEGVPVALRAPWSFDAPRGRRDLCEQLKVATLEAFGVEESPELLSACGALLDFLRDTQKSAVEQIRDLQRHRPSRHLVLDRATRRTLEITQSQLDGGREGTLLSVVDRTETPMGARLLRDWLLEPLVEHAAIVERHDAVAALVENTTVRRSLRQALDGLGDLERVAAKIAAGRGGARELAALAGALERVPALRAHLSAWGTNEIPGEAPGALRSLHEALDPCTQLAASIRAMLVEEPPLGLKEGGLIREGFDSKVDEFRGLASGGKQYLAELQARETERTGISNLKLGFNRVFGYYIEITSSHASRVPEDYIRKQTLKNAERYITPELKEYEAKVLGAEEKLYAREYELFLALRDQAGLEVGRLLACARAVAELDVLAALAELAVQRRYVRPQLIEALQGETESGFGAVLDIRNGRHPVVEAALLEDPFVPNDARLGGEHARLAILTGPNMSGKSTYLRQTALIVLLAQMGSFVPADAARLGVVDRIFTRLGGGDDISRGASTFMVEMVETANILRHATERSLLLLDEVGRGTSTFDGLAIAWAVCEHVHNSLAARCLFATHYHQLTDLAESLPAARNLNVAVREWGDEIVFLHRIDEGGTDRSYGIHVGRLAGLPEAVLARSRDVLAKLERDEEGLSQRILEGVAGAPVSREVEVQQPGLFDALQETDPELLAELRAADLNRMPPIEAWQLLQRVQEALRQA